MRTMRRGPTCPPPRHQATDRRAASPRLGRRNGSSRPTRRGTSCRPPLTGGVARPPAPATFRERDLQSARRARRSAGSNGSGWAAPVGATPRRWPTHRTMRSSARGCTRRRADQHTAAPAPAPQPGAPQPAPEERRESTDSLAPCRALPAAFPAANERVPTRGFRSSTQPRIVK